MAVPALRMQDLKAMDDIEGPIFFMTANGGGGHKASAVAVRDNLQAQGVKWAEKIELVYIEPIVDEAAEPCISQIIPRSTDIYNWLMVRGFYSVVRLTGYLALLSNWKSRGRVRARFAEIWRKQRPALIVSFVPFINGALRESLESELPDVKLVTVVTDMENAATQQWIPRGETSNHYVMAGTDLLESQARSLGYERQLVRTSGMVVHPMYYAEPASMERASVKTKVVVFFGGLAPNRTEGIVRNAVIANPDVQFVVICGRNKQLQAALADLPEENCVLEGFIPAQLIRSHLEGAACVIGKPGPGVVSEAAVCKVPFVVERRAMPQEQCVLNYLQESRTGIVVNSLERLPEDFVAQASACKQVLMDQKHQNRAVFEVSDFIMHILSSRFLADDDTETTTDMSEAGSSVFAASSSSRTDEGSWAK